MDSKIGHPWNVTLEEARELQSHLSRQIKETVLPSTIRQVAGFDVSYLKERNLIIAGMAILGYPSLDLIDQFLLTDRIPFPYIPGYLSFREAPVLLKLIRQNCDLADIYVFDGHGIAHPRGLGIASHIGVMVQKPSIGCAKKKLIGQYDEPMMTKGAISPLIYQDRIVGNVVRTKNNIKPVYISIGNRISLKDATEFILTCTNKYRIPEPTRQAHICVTNYRKKLLSNSSDDVKCN